VASATETAPAGPQAPREADLEELRDAAASCTACHLHLLATQTVFGEGPSRAPLMLIGEQPGDQEDLQGRPFVGPAGGLLDRALEEAGISREDAYVTNVVKHFKWVKRGKRRIHDKPNAAEVRACRPWLEREIELVKPEVIVLLGATAAQAMLGRDFRVSLHQGDFVDSPLAPFVMTTVHPSSLLRASDTEARRAGIERFTADLRKAASALNHRTSLSGSRSFANSGADDFVDGVEGRPA
jgi:DNA polymerase